MSTEDGQSSVETEEAHHVLRSLLVSRYLGEPKGKDAKAKKLEQESEEILRKDLRSHFERKRYQDIAADHTEAMQRIASLEQELVVALQQREEEKKGRQQEMIFFREQIQKLGTSGSEWRNKIESIMHERQRWNAELAQEQSCRTRAEEECGDLRASLDRSEEQRLEALNNFEQLTTEHQSLKQTHAATLLQLQTLRASEQRSAHQTTLLTAQLREQQHTCDLTAQLRTTNASLVEQVQILHQDLLSTLLERETSFREFVAVRATEAHRLLYDRFSHATQDLLLNSALGEVSVRLTNCLKKAQLEEEFIDATPRCTLVESVRSLQNILPTLHTAVLRLVQDNRTFAMDQLELMNQVRETHRDSQSSFANTQQLLSQWEQKAKTEQTLRLEGEMLLGTEHVYRQHAEERCALLEAQLPLLAQHCKSLSSHSHSQSGSERCSPFALTDADPFEVQLAVGTRDGEIEGLEKQLMQQVADCAALKEHATALESLLQHLRTELQGERRKVVELKQQLIQCEQTDHHAALRAQCELYREHEQHIQQKLERVEVEGQATQQQVKVLEAEAAMHARLLLEEKLITKSLRAQLERPTNTSELEPNLAKSDSREKTRRITALEEELQTHRSSSKISDDPPNLSCISNSCDQGGHPMVEEIQQRLEHASADALAIVQEMEKQFSTRGLQVETMHADLEQLLYASQVEALPPSFHTRLHQVSAEVTKLLQCKATEFITTCEQLKQVRRQLQVVSGDIELLFRCTEERHGKEWHQSACERAEQIAPPVECPTDPSHDSTFDQLQQQLQELCDHRASLSTLLEEREEDLELLRAHVRELEAQQTAAESKAARDEQTLMETTAAHKELKERLQHLRDDLANKTQELQGVKAKVWEAQDLHTSEEESHTQRTRESDARLRALMHEQGATIAALREQLNLANADLEEACATRDLAISKLEEAEDELLSNRRRGLTDGSKLAGELASLRKQLHTKNLRIKEATASLAEQEAVCRQLRLTNRQLQTHLERLEADHRSPGVSPNAAPHHPMEKDQAPPKRVTVLGDTSAFNVRGKEEARKEARQRQLEYESQRVQWQKREARLLEQIQHLESTHRAEENAKLVGLEALVEVQESQMKQMSQLIQKEWDRPKPLATSVQTQTSEIQVQTVERLTRELHECRAEHTHTQHQLCELETHNSQLRLQVDQLKEDVRSHEETVERLTRELHECRAEHTHAQHQLCELETHNSRLRLQVDQLKEDVRSHEETRRQLEDATSQVATHTHTIAQLHAEIAKARVCVQAQQVMLDTLTTEMGEGFQERDERLQQTQRLVKQLEERVEGLKRQSKVQEGSGAQSNPPEPHNPSARANPSHVEALERRIKELLGMVSDKEVELELAHLHSARALDAHSGRIGPWDDAEVSQGGAGPHRSTNSRA
eukprot:NODE_24_length_4436_cov_26.467162_g22_i0.p1 GENE.NODE_24_length_4436_cov_26.467162_g22_i0~~NODE_24_length_4436_cov_26.467162_g22_i0.p1  ORF type:complete len:1413 (-),score=447.18 NODE_24_length_4436_cov_26.467162_g22_i0:146-4384(-)